jgi:cytochrome bd ubiquinol oxidase subunit II
MDLNLIWFALLGLLLAGYAILDGFDFGVGILHPLARTDAERRVFINAIGPIWDGNEVWLITFGGALFAAFPEAYATVFSGFYLAIMLLLFALILRAVSIEFRSKVEARAWRRVWDTGFFLASLLASALFGITVGNSILGVPLNERGVFVGSFGSLFGTYPLLVGALTAALFAMHGALYLCLKVPHGPLLDRVKEWAWHTWGVFLVLYVLVTIYTLLFVPRAVENVQSAPWLVMIAVLNVLAIANIPRAVYKDSLGQAFLSSCMAILLLVGLFGAAQFPNLVTANNEETSLTIYNAASSEATLTIMLIIALIGMPLVLTYTAVVYWTFRKRVKLEPTSY